MKKFVAQKFRVYGSGVDLQRRGRPFAKLLGGNRSEVTSEGRSRVAPGGGTGDRFCLVEGEIIG